MKTLDCTLLHKRNCEPSSRTRDKKHVVSSAMTPLAHDTRYPYHLSCNGLQQLRNCPIDVMLLAPSHRSAQHSRRVADRGFCERCSSERTASTLRGHALFKFTLSGRPREGRTANYKYRPIRTHAAAEIHSLVSLPYPMQATRVGSLNYIARCGAFRAAEKAQHNAVHSSWRAMVAEHEKIGMVRRRRTVPACLAIPL